MLASKTAKPEKIENPESESSESKFDLNIKSTAEVQVPEKLIEQIVGQETAVEIAKKASAQKRNILLIGLPGTGKSLLAQAMSELMPVQQLHDILIYPNRQDPNTPKVRVVKAGEGKKIIHKLRTDAKGQEDNSRMLTFLLSIGWFILSYVVWKMGWIPDVVYAATLILGGFLFIGIALGSQMKAKTSAQVPKLLIDNSGRKAAPFLEGTGARAGALLGDVRHDPLQCHYGFNDLLVEKKQANSSKFVKKSFAALWSEMFSKYGKEIIRNKKGHEAIMLSDKEKVFTLGYKDGKVVLSRILSLNRQPFEGDLVELKAKGNKIALTPEHEVNTSTIGKKASKISKKDFLISLSG